MVDEEIAALRTFFLGKRLGLGLGLLDTKHAAVRVGSTILLQSGRVAMKRATEGEKERGDFH